jgi:hypothetical protein
MICMEINDPVGHVLKAANRQKISGSRPFKPGQSPVGNEALRRLCPLKTAGGDTAGVPPPEDS